jgi:hypothetical protein
MLEPAPGDRRFAPAPGTLTDRGRRARLVDPDRGDHQPLLGPGVEDLDHDAVEVLPLADRLRTQSFPPGPAQIEGEHQPDVVG